ncbi:MAG TPA: carboxylating nicotinate-nucleotide diphosphorylase [Myxococcaceae bacterium]|nr:carboxylating nicotinate-nucleotide diphosphorylase [Myxococcaceae bacterium]
MDALDRLIDLALDEDLGAAGDVTTEALVPATARGRGDLVAKEPLVFAGGSAFARVFQRLEPAASVELRVPDGARVRVGTIAASVSAALRTLLVGERTALNLVQRTCGIATLAAEAAAAVRGTGTRVLDTRKTSPGMRALSKQAVRAGGAENHRFGLFDGVLIKDNHLATVGGDVREALRRARAGAPRLVKVEVEVTALDQLQAAIDGGADLVLLDNMDDAQVAEAVRIVRGRVKLEVSGGVTLERLPQLAALGVDYVSMGALTHSARAMDLSLELHPEA